MTIRKSFSVFYCYCCFFVLFSSFISLFCFYLFNIYLLFKSMYWNLLFFQLIFLFLNQSFSSSFFFLHNHAVFSSFDHFLKIWHKIKNVNKVINKKKICQTFIYIGTWTAKQNLIFCNPNQKSTIRWSESNPSISIWIIKLTRNGFFLLTTYFMLFLFFLIFSWYFNSSKNRDRSYEIVWIYFKN